MKQIEVQITIGGRPFAVACQAGEEAFLMSAARLLDGEARVLSQHMGDIPAERLLLMAGLMLADKTAGLEERLRESEAKVQANEEAVAKAQADLELARATPAAEPVSEELEQALRTLLTQAESIADAVEEKASASA